VAQFASADDLGTFLGSPLDAEQIAQADLLLQLASAAIQDEAHQTLELVEDDKASLKGTYKGELYLPERPVLAVGDITIRNGSGLPTALAITATQFAWDRSGLLRRGPWLGGGVETNADVPWGGWGGPYATVEVTYSHGYEIIPNGIRSLCLQIAARAMASPEGMQVQTESVDGAMSVTYGTAKATGLALTDDEMRAARRYRPVAA
jgi:hypothetical protein